MRELDKKYWIAPSETDSYSYMWYARSYTGTLAHTVCFEGAPLRALCLCCCPIVIVRVFLYGCLQFQTKILPPQSEFTYVYECELCVAQY